MENLQRLRVLRAVAQHGSFTAAGAVLGMSQPAVSQHVTTLERELETRLVERTTLGTRLTPEGELVLRHAMRILASCDDVRRELDELRSGDLAPVRVAAFPTACGQLLPRAAALWRRRYPSVPFEFTECDADEAVESARHGTADLALTYDYAAHPIDLRHLAPHPLPDDPLLLALPVSHPLATAPVVEIGMLADEAWISGTSFGCAESLRAVCGVAGFTPVIALDSNRYPTTLAMVAAGHGVALVPSSALLDPPPDVTVRPLRPVPAPRRLWALTRHRPATAVSHLLDCLVATATPHRHPAQRKAG
ncbi:LysR family transcriptional regulator [Streptomyces sp. S.PB5]|uniref:LysR family transcriptional regulator n=1 Tax=Streptomyces sp. S.PB5 TaxID=3020844 RepID=UPI0025AF0362|nr:LysR family transcriptional regulator [Streptomyces sp. S.PB5]MDN3025837.1 LysR family transcriptional regulator [Streptomyces sp. S.PB5]